MRLDIEPNVATPPVSDEVEERAAVASQEARSMLSQGIKAAQAGNRALARMSLQTATELDPKNESAWLWLASISEYPEELLGFLNHVLEINPENQRANEWKIATHALLAKTFVQRGIDACDENHKDFANECFQKALEYNENNATAYLWMASLSDSNVEKISLLEKALEIEPGNDLALTALEAAKQSVLKYGLTEAKAAAVSGSNPEAIRILDDLLSIYPDSIEALTMKSHLAEGFDEKIRCFENILEIDPDNLAARSGRDSLLAIFGTMEATKTESSSRAEAYSNLEMYTADVVESFEPAIDKSPTQDLELPATIAQATHLFDAPAASPENETYTEVEDDNDTVQAFAEPFATYAEEVSESPSFDFDEVRVDEESNEFLAMEDAHVNREPDASHSDPHAETVAFSYEEMPDITAAEDEPSRPSGEFVIPMPASELPEAPVESAAVTFVVKPDTVDCVFCGKANDAQSISCQACMSVLTLSDLELLLGNPTADTIIVRQAVEKMEERKRSSSDDFTVEELTVLGLGHLNLRNLQLGYAALSEASRLDPNNVVLSSQVNSLLIRLEEIRLQEEAHLKMPKGKSILVVDDSATVRKLIAGKLEKSGHQVICANDGVEAMERLDDLIPDLILLDIAMPRMDGYQVCKNIRSKAATKDVPVVMISGKDGFFDKVRGRMAGTTGYITKPFGPETLMKAVEMYLSGGAPDLDEV